MAQSRKRSGGFTLTEILMAVGILGIGMSMVASIFPVAVDQSRRSRDLTYAALAARSTAAMLRARRAKVVDWIRQNLVDNKPLPGVLPDEYVIYNPSAFLYLKDRTYSGIPKWNPGNYTCRVWFTPVALQNGPWRATIAVYRATGSEPDAARYSEQPTGAGEYVLDDEDERGEGYLVDRVAHPTSPPRLRIHVGTGEPAVGVSLDRNCISLPGAVAVYHTIVGD